MRPTELRALALESIKAEPRLQGRCEASQIKEEVVAAGKAQREEGAKRAREALKAKNELRCNRRKLKASDSCAGSLCWWGQFLCGCSLSVSARAPLAREGSTPLGTCGVESFVGVGGKRATSAHTTCPPWLRVRSVDNACGCALRCVASASPSGDRITR